MSMLIVKYIMNLMRLDEKLFSDKRSFISGTVIAQNETMKG